MAIVNEMEKCRNRIENISKQHKAKEKEYIQICEMKITKLQKELQIKSQEMKQWHDFMQKQTQELSKLTEERNTALLEKDQFQNKYQHISQEIQRLQKKNVPISKNNISIIQNYYKPRSTNKSLPKIEYKLN